MTKPEPADPHPNRPPQAAVQPTGELTLGEALDNAVNLAEQFERKPELPPAPSLRLVSEAADAKTEATPSQQAYHGQMLSDADPAIFERSTCSLDDCAAILGVGRGTIRGMLARRELPRARAMDGSVWQPGGRVLIDAPRLRETLTGDALGRFEEWQAGRLFTGHRGSKKRPLTTHTDKS